MSLLRSNFAAGEWMVDVGFSTQDALEDCSFSGPPMVLSFRSALTQAQISEDCVEVTAPRELSQLCGLDQPSSISHSMTSVSNQLTV